MSTKDKMVYKIGVVGPTRVGKTSLITSILKDSQKLLAGTPLSIRPHGTPTEKRLMKHADELSGSLRAGEFNPGTLKGTEETFTFELELTPGDADIGILLELLDYPGGWLNPGSRPEGRKDEWLRCVNWLKESSVILIPVDASVLMEATERRHKIAAPAILMANQVAQVAREWAKERNRRYNEPALMLICPLKCESYFTDNGGQRYAAPKLLEEVRHVYAEMIEAVRDEAKKVDITIIYAPVDTIGCVDIVSADWKENENASGGFEFSADYRVRHPKRQSVIGADNVLVSLCKHLVEAKRQVETENAKRINEEAEIIAIDAEIKLTEAQKTASSARRKILEAKLAKEYADEYSGIFNSIANWFTGEGDKRNDIARHKNEDAIKISDEAGKMSSLAEHKRKEAIKAAEEVNFIKEQISALNAQIEQIAEKKLSERVKVL